MNRFLWDYLSPTSFWFMSSLQHCQFYLHILSSSEVEPFWGTFTLFASRILWYTGVYGRLADWYPGPSRHTEPEAWRLWDGAAVVNLLPCSWRDWQLSLLHVSTILNARSASDRVHRDLQTCWFSSTMLQLLLKCYAVQKETNDAEAISGSRNLFMLSLCSWWRVWFMGCM